MSVTGSLMQVFHRSYGIVDPDEWIRGTETTVIRRMRLLHTKPFYQAYFKVGLPTATPRPDERFVQLTMDLEPYYSETMHPYQREMNDLFKKLVTKEEIDWWTTEIALRAMK